MDDVDGIIFVSLRPLGCLGDLNSLDQITPDHLVETLAAGLKAINPKRFGELPNKLPPLLASRYRVATAIADACKELGFRGELGYHQLLYSNVSESRRVLGWLVEQMPKTGASQNESDVPGSSGFNFETSIATQAHHRLKQPWVPVDLLPHGLFDDARAEIWHYRSVHCFTPLSAAPLAVPAGYGDPTILITSDPITKEQRRYQERHCRPVTAQALGPAQLGTSVLQREAALLTRDERLEQEWDAAGLTSGRSKKEHLLKKRAAVRDLIQQQVKTALADAAHIRCSLEPATAAGRSLIGSRFSYQAQFMKEDSDPITQNETEEDLQKRREAELEELRQRLEGLLSSISTMETTVSEQSLAIKDFEKQIADATTENEKLEAAYLLKKRTFDLLADPEASIANLEAQIAESAARMADMRQKFEARLATHMRINEKLQAERDGFMSSVKTKADEIKDFRGQLRQIISVARERQELHEQLSAQLEEFLAQQEQGGTRSQYTDRIMEIVGNVKKQNRGITQVLSETRALQREISHVSAKLDRAFTATDELIYREARTNDFSKEAYRIVAALHSLFDGLVGTCQSAGQMETSLHELQDRIDRANARGISDSLAQIRADLAQVEEESLALSRARQIDILTAE